LLQLNLLPLGDQFCYEAWIDVVELDLYFEPAFVMIESNHSFSAARIGGPFGEVTMFHWLHAALCFPPYALPFVIVCVQMENLYKNLEWCLIQISFKVGSSGMRKNITFIRGIIIH